MVKEGNHKFSNWKMVIGSLGKSHVSHISWTTTKKLFGPSDNGQFALDEDKRDDIAQISPDKNEKLIDVITEQKVKEAVFQMKHNKAPDSDGFPAEFYQIF
jgi:hypothetical protein